MQAVNLRHKKLQLQQRLLNRRNHSLAAMGHQTLQQSHTMSNNPVYWTNVYKLTDGDAVHAATTTGHHGCWQWLQELRQWNLPQC